jgi:protease-4
MNIDSLRNIADGRIFTGKQAIKVHLVDTIGSYEDALAYIKNFTGVSQKSQVIEKKKRESFLKNVLYNQLADHFPFLKSVNAPAGSYFLFKMGF